METNRCWVVVDMTHGVATDGLRELTHRIHRLVDPDPIYALIQSKPKGEFHELRGWNSGGSTDDAHPLMFVDFLPLPADELVSFKEVMVVGADVGLHVLSTSLSLFSDNVSVVMETSLYLSHDDEESHYAAMRVMTKQLGEERAR